ncbi:MAG: zinc ribbon domain-containing protein [Actinobacteria bacterium]|nr:zinc ribbon domain-containing protein [Actinomycetota bacterium]
MTGNDWYAVLGLPTDASTEDISAAVEKRSRQASAMANTAPERSQQLREQVRAIKQDLLSGDGARARYDATRPGAAPARPEVPAQHEDPAWPAGNPQPGQQPGGGYGQPGQPRPDPVQAGQGRRPGRFLAFLQSGWTCPACGESYLPGDKFCTQCNHQLTADGTYVPVPPPANPNACYYCGTIAATTHRFCRNCGAGRP